MDKSPDAFRTITEVAEWLDTPAHVLRFWESRFSQIKPVKRAGGRRYYRPTDMLLLGGIKKLLHDDGTTIKGAQKILREQGIKHVQSLSIPVSVQVTIKRKSQAEPAESATQDKAKTPPQPTAAPAPEADSVSAMSLSANRPRVKPRTPVESESQPEPEVVDVKETRPVVSTEESNEKVLIDQPRSADSDETNLIVGKFPDTLKKASEISPKDMQDIEALYYGLKMVRNNMMRTGAER